MSFKFAHAGVVTRYHEHLVPRIFDPLALVLLEASRFSRGEHMLDVACGPGTVARMAAELVGPFGRVTAADISEEMLAVAQGLPARTSEAAPVEYVVAGAEKLPFPDQEFDLVICQQGLQFFPDQKAALLEMRRVLKPSGRIAVAVWAEIQQCPYFQLMHESLLETVPAEIANLLTQPFSFPYAPALAHVLKDAGFTEVHVETVSRPLIFEEGVEHAIAALDGTPLGPHLAELPKETLDAFHETAKRHLKNLIWNKRVETVMVSNIAVGHNHSD